MADGISPEIEARLSTLSDEELDFIDSLPAEEVRELLAPPNPGRAIKDTVADAVDAAASTAAEVALGPRGGEPLPPVEPLADFLTENLALGAGEEAGAAGAARVASRFLPHPAARLIATATGAALGAAGADAGVDVARGEPVDVDPVNAGIAAAGPFVPGTLRAGGKLARGTAKVAGHLKEPTKLAKRLLSMAGATKSVALEKFGNVVDPASNVPAAFGMRAKAFDVRNPNPPAEAVLRLDRRGVFQAAEPKGNRLSRKLQEKAGPQSIYTDFKLIRKALEADKVRLIGEVADLVGPVEPRNVPLSGDLGYAVAKLSRNGDKVRLDTAIPLGTIEESWEALRSQKYGSATATGKVDESADRLIRREVEKLRDLTLTDAERAELASARGVIERAHREILRSDAATLRAVEDLSPREIQEAFGVRYDKKTGVPTDDVRTQRALRKWEVYSEALQKEEALVAASRERPIEFGDVYKKRISLDKLASFGPEAENAPLASQVLTDLADDLRSRMDIIAAQKGGREGQDFLRFKAEVADVFAVEDFVYRSEAGQNVPRMTGVLALGLGPTVARNVAGQTRSTGFRLTRRNLGQILRQQAMTAAVGSAGSIVPSPPAKLLDAAGQYTLKVADVLSSHENAPSWLANTIVNATVFSFLRERGLEEAGPEEVVTALQSPEVLQLLQETGQQAMAEIGALSRALALNDTETATAELSRLAKTFPEAFQAPQSGVFGEVMHKGKPYFPDPADRAAFAKKVVELSDASPSEKGKVLSSLKKNGTVEVIPSGLK